MPPYKMKILPYPVFLNAGDDLNPTPAAPERNYLLIQNKGVNPATIMFGKPAGTNPGMSIVIAGGTSFSWDMVIPVESINVSSVLGTTLTIWEGREVVK